MMTEAEYGRQWRALAWDEGHRAGVPTTTYNNKRLEFDDSDIRARLRAGEPIRSIAASLGATQNSIHSFIRRRRIPIRKLRKEGAA